MPTHALAEALERPQLKLLDRAFRPMEGRSHLANALLLHEAHPDDLTLQVRQSIDLSIQRQPTFDVLGLAGIRKIRWDVLRLWTASSPVVRQRVRGDPKEPGGYWNTTPLELTYRSECLLEHLGRDVLGVGPVCRPTAHERVDAIDVPVVELHEPRGIALHGFDQEPVIVHGVRHVDPNTSILVTGTDARKLRGNLWRA